MERCITRSFVRSSAGLRFRFYVSADVTARDRSVRNRRLHLSLSLSLPPSLSLSSPFPSAFFSSVKRAAPSGCRRRMPAMISPLEKYPLPVIAPIPPRARASNRESKEDN